MYNSNNTDRYLDKLNKGKQIISLAANLLVLSAYIIDMVLYHDYYDTFKFILQIQSILLSLFLIFSNIINRDKFFSVSYVIMSYNLILNILITYIFCRSYIYLHSHDSGELFSRNLIFILIFISTIGFISGIKHVLIQGVLLTVFIVYEFVGYKDEFIKESIILYLIVGIAYPFVIHGIVSIFDKFINQLKESNSHIRSLVSSLMVKEKQILSSIKYAKRLQTAILPPNKLVEKYLINSFILYKPKDIIAGDFYWMEVIGDNIIFALADSTGHGVPGAMISVICHNSLNRAVREFNLLDPGQILDKTNENVIEYFNRSEEIIKDGMDIALCVYNHKQSTLKYSGANRPLLLCSNNTITKIKADFQGIGNCFDSQPFRTHTLNLKKGDSIYLFSDGYIDQFGGPKQKKFKYGKLKELILENQLKSMEDQKQYFEHSFDTWKGDQEQTDDVCIIGVRFD